MIVLRFEGGTGVVGRMIRLATWSWCSHVDVEAPDGGLVGAMPGQGVVRRPAPFDVGRVERYALDLEPETERQVRAALAGQIGKPYDWPGILGWALRRDWQDTDRWFCSELIAWAFAQAGHPLLRAADVWRITPRDLLLSPLLRAAGS